MRIKKMITKGELRPVLKQFLPTSTKKCFGTNKENLYVDTGELKC